MAENVKWILDNEGPMSKIMLWAHNGHVSTFPDGAGETMGMTLRRMYGKKMVVCGFSFDHGSFQAIQQGKAEDQFGWLEEVHEVTDFKKRAALVNGSAHVNGSTN